MAADLHPTRLWRFKPEVEAVLTQDQSGKPWMYPCVGQRFTVIGPGNHPTGVACMLGEIYSGKEDGMRFFLEPTWEQVWERIAEPVD